MEKYLNTHTVTESYAAQLLTHSQSVAHSSSNLVEQVLEFCFGIQENREKNRTRRQTFFSIVRRQKNSVLIK